MNKKILTEDVEKNLKYAKDSYGKQNSFDPMMLVKTSKDGKSGVIAAVIVDERAYEKRSDIAFDLGIRAGIELCKNNVDSVDAFYSVSEAWLSYAKNFSVRPKDDPKKKEVLMSIGMSKDGEVASRIYEIKKSIDLKTGAMKTDFEMMSPLESGNSEKSEPKAFLLQNFWAGVEMMEMFNKEGIPSGYREEFWKMPSDELFEVFHRNLEKIRKN